MRELSLHVYDLIENAIVAKASKIELTINDSLKDDIYFFTIKDNGAGMNSEFLANVTDPWITTRTTRKIGIGIPLTKMKAEAAGGGMNIESEPDKGTTIKFWFQHKHIDRQPMGDIAGTIVMLCSQHENIHFIYNHISDEGSYTFNTNELKEILNGMSINNITFIKYLKEMIQDNLGKIGYND